MLKLLMLGRQKILMSKQNFMVSGPKFIKFFFCSTQKKVVDNAVYSLLIS